MPQKARQLGIHGEDPPRLGFNGGGFLAKLRVDRPPRANAFPFVSAIRATKSLAFHPAVTFFIGENGSGKSTLLEAIAVKFGFSSEGGARRGATEGVPRSSDLDQYLTLERIGYPRDGWFLRAESFHNFATELDELDREPFCAHGYAAYGGKSLHAQSHGEAFLALLTNRLQRGGLYLFDEPEAALSPQRQLAVLTLLHRLVYHGSQLIIATHSPILLSYPHARIYEFSDAGIRAIAYAETEHYRVTRDFLNSHERMLELLLRAEEEDLKGKER